MESSLEGKAHGPVSFASINLLQIATIQSQDVVQWAMTFYQMLNKASCMNKWMMNSFIGIKLTPTAINFFFFY